MRPHHYSVPRRPHVFPLITQQRAQNGLYRRQPSSSTSLRPLNLEYFIPAALDPNPLDPKYLQRTSYPSFSAYADYAKALQAATRTAIMPYKLVCLENPLLDIQAEGTPALLHKYNLKANDAILASPEHQPLYPELLSLNAVKIAGGAAQNTARGAQYILPPHTVLYIGAVGADDAAKTLKNASADAGLDTEYMVVHDQPTGRCGVVITGNNRSLCTDLGAANHYKPTHLQSPEVWAHAAAAEFFYVGGYHLTVSPEAAAMLGKEAAEKNKVFVLNLSAPFIPAFFKDPLAQTIRYADVLIGNETEAASWAESQGWLEDKRKDVKGIAQAIAALPKENPKRGRTVIITQGTDQTIVVKDGKLSEYSVHAIDSSKICDTNGAGDAFAGGFMGGLVEGKDVGTCVDMGHWLARLSIQELGPSQE